MNATPETGYIYRVPQASAEQLQALVATHVRDGSTFGVAAQWDFDPHCGPDNLRKVTAFDHSTAIDVSGDFGHAFNAIIEVRWKRRDDDTYDVLILSETPQTIAGSVPLHIGTKQQWHIRRYTNTALVQTSDHPAIGYIDYLAPNGAVQFQRFTKVKS